MTQKYLIILALCLMGMNFCSFGAMAGQNVGIAAVVNDEAISFQDVEDRIKLVLASSGLPDGKDIRAKILPQILDGLIEEQIKLQEATRNNLSVSQEEIDQGLATIAEQNKFTPEQFLAIMQKQGVPKNTLIHQIRAQLSWNNVVKEKLRNQVDVSAIDVDTRIARLKTKMGQTEYLVSEIFLPTDDKKRMGEVQQFSQRMASELQAKKAPFGPVAAQFSKAAGAEKGGNLGWVAKGDLEPDLDRAIIAMEEGQVSNPIKTNTGIYILLLQKKRVFDEKSIPPRDELTNEIGFERLDRVQQRTLLNLKSAAFIDRRI